jgi:hypothetical protein
MSDIYISVGARSRLSSVPSTCAATAAGGVVVMLILGMFIETPWTPFQKKVGTRHCSWRGLAIHKTETNIAQDPTDAHPRSWRNKED